MKGGRDASKVKQEESIDRIFFLSLWPLRATPTTIPRVLDCYGVVGTDGIKDGGSFSIVFPLLSSHPRKTPLQLSLRLFAPPTPASVSWSRRRKRKGTERNAQEKEGWKMGRDILKGNSDSDRPSPAPVPYPPPVKLKLSLLFSSLTLTHVHSNIKEQRFFSLFLFKNILKTKIFFLLHSIWIDLNSELEISYLEFFC